MADGSSLSGGGFLSSNQERALPQIQPRTACGWSALVSMPLARFSPLETGLEIMKMILRRQRQGQNGFWGLKRSAFGQFPRAVLTGAAPAVVGWHTGAFAASFMRHLHRAARLGRCLSGASHAQRAPAHRQADAQAEQEGYRPEEHDAFVDLNVARARFECEKAIYARSMPILAHASRTRIWRI